MTATDVRGAPENGVVDPIADTLGREVLLVNHWHDDNKGDSAITIVTIALLRAALPGVRVHLASMLGPSDPALGRAFRHVRSAFPAATTRASFVPSLSTEGTPPSPLQALAWAVRVAGAGIRTAFRRPPRALADAVDAADLVVVIGGSDLFDTGRRAPLSTLRLLQCVLPVLVAKQRHTKYILLGHTLGPVTTRLGRRLLATVVRDAELTVVRESHSMELVRGQLGLDLGERLKVAPDVAFALEPISTDRVDALLDPFRTTRFAVLVPRAYHQGDARRDDHLVTEMVALGRAALDAGLVETVLVFPQCLGPTSVEDDRVIATRIADSDPRFRLVDVDLSPGEVAEFYRHATFLVAVRLHALILGLSVGTPVHGIEYFTNKTRGVFAEHGLDEHWSEFDAFDGVAALARVVELLTPEKIEYLRHRADAMRAGVHALQLARLVA
ncbi:MAG: polysaccharide pyruvyl transferase family protein [Ilumatobacteraceae bacterium]